MTNSRFQKSLLKSSLALSILVLGGTGVAASQSHAVHADTVQTAASTSTNQSTANSGVTSDSSLPTPVLTSSTVSAGQDISGQIDMSKLPAGGSTGVELTDQNGTAIGEAIPDAAGNFTFKMNQLNLGSTVAPNSTYNVFVATVGQDADGKATIQSSQPATVTVNPLTLGSLTITPVTSDNQTISGTANVPDLPSDFGLTARITNNSGDVVSVAVNSDGTFTAAKSDFAHGLPAGSAWVQIQAKSQDAAAPVSVGAPQSITVPDGLNVSVPTGTVPDEPTFSDGNTIAIDSALPVPVVNSVTEGQAITGTIDTSKIPSGTRAIELVDQNGAALGEAPINPDGSFSISRLNLGSTVSPNTTYYAFLLTEETQDGTPTLVRSSSTKVLINPITLNSVTVKPVSDTSEAVTGNVDVSSLPAGFELIAQITNEAGESTSALVDDNGNFTLNKSDLPSGLPAGSNFWIQIKAKAAGSDDSVNVGDATKTTVAAAVAPGSDNNNSGSSSENSSNGSSASGSTATNSDNSSSNAGNSSTGSSNSGNTGNSTTGNTSNSSENSQNSSVDSTKDTHNVSAIETPALTHAAGQAVTTATDPAQPDLPQTGDAQSNTGILAAIGAALVALLSMVGINLRKKNI
ncbi:LPXTG cell wall anchor domain-containing protein [Lacticaseibacillus brantae]|uniref:LPXTG cell wall anchor domain-containing protein n=1 Tax=Lacticaseibacillus brantae TaxID=943673 RepID=UPI00071067C1|nr:LPXTG cell wall anchor domain-containing protein [Lacticaseibacillus brantae]